MHPGTCLLVVLVLFNTVRIPALFISSSSSSGRKRWLQVCRPVCVCVCLAGGNYAAAIYYWHTLVGDDAFEQSSRCPSRSIDCFFSVLPPKWGVCIGVSAYWSECVMSCRYILDVHCTRMPCVPNQKLPRFVCKGRTTLSML